MSKYFIYSLSDPTEDVPFYIGYAKREQRLNDHINEALNWDGIRKPKINALKLNKIKKILRRGDEILIKRLVESDTKKDIIQEEINFIQLYGRRDIKTGCLTNMTDGGDGAGSRVYPEEELEKRRQRLLGKTYDEIYGEELGDIIKKKISVKATGRVYDSAWNTGLSKENNESVRQISEKNKGKIPWNKGKVGVQIGSMLGKKHSTESLEKIRKHAESRNYSGKNNPMYGKKGAASGRSWYVNSFNETLYLKSEEGIPEGYIKGRKWKI